ncbi:PKD domain-containing protein [Halorientalis marina]|uniref:PKD domain-containing protein n=1 Tax=Halorientalis marina TaxID=2931976 RepID=UPI0027E21CA0|nr:PKD domain-containing protein [Halorientalis marina]
MADAGLDQQVEYGATVRLDATGSRDPDGDVRAYEWRIERPNGTTVEPDCRSCGRTSFRPRAVGTYEVTVTVTDDDGVSRSDTLYVEVDGGTGPSVSLSGPQDPPTATDQLYTARVEAGTVPIDQLTWIVDGETVAETTATAGNESRTFRFGDTSETVVTVRVTDRANQTATANRTIEPRLNRGVRPSRVGDDGPPPVGTYIPAKDVWIRSGAIETEEEAIAFAIEGSQALDESEKGGYHVDRSLDEGDGGSSDGDDGGGGNNLNRQASSKNENNNYNSINSVIDKAKSVLENE